MRLHTPLRPLRGLRDLCVKFPSIPSETAPGIGFRALSRFSRLINPIRVNREDRKVTRRLERSRERERVEDRKVGR